MIRKLSIALTSSLICALFLSSCGGVHGGARIDADLSTETTAQVAEAVAALGINRGTRLHPEYIHTALADPAVDEKIKAAQDAALSKGDEASRLALVRALEHKFIHDPSLSVLDLLGPELSEHFRKFDWQPADYPGDPEGANEALADIMVDALDLIFPERRVNRTRDAVVLRSEATEEVWAYMESEWVPIPAEEDYKANRHAMESYVRMREAARLDGVELVVLSAHRSREKAEANAARANNPSAVASFSAHSLGLAIDFKMSHGEFQVEEITTRPMADVVRMRESPVHKWLFLNADKFGWYPYQNEPWHWEYNPPGFRDVFFANFPGGAPLRVAGE